MTPKLTEEMREALGRQPGGPIEIQDDETNAVSVLVAREAFGKLVGDTLRQGLLVGLEQSDRGESEPWDAGDFLEEAHRKQTPRRA